jgi:membrane protease YdiL (CAAX protease family)
MKIKNLIDNNKSHLNLFLWLNLLNVISSYSLASILTSLNFTFFLSALSVESTQKTSFFLLLVNYVLIAPIIEEYIFRYPSILLLRKNTGSRLITFLIYLTSSFMFSIIHSMGEIRFPIIQFLIGIFSLYIGNKSNIYYCIAFHSLNNLIAILQI